ncbi:fatty acyl-AMP ligase [Synechococcus sp. PCC 7336]|uniref:fatty acyl-AMP ligase n=1 Tax=Synechococcus sp. PCC 7336 TaxID=195250 RepID=UPI0003454347|nr:fatty acyl-AMP ligase [Synechococcus sp. PCC 7336]
MDSDRLEINSIISDLPLVRFLKNCQEFPDFVCGNLLSCEGNIQAKITFSDWQNKAVRIALALRERGVQVGDRVVLSLPTSEAFLVVFKALWLLRAVPVPLPELSSIAKKGVFFERIVHVAGDCSPAGFVVLESARVLLKEMEGDYPILSTFQAWTWEDLLLSDPEAELDLDSVVTHTTKETKALIQYTSGSTGHPNGVIVTQGMLQANIQAMGDVANISRQDKLLKWMPLYHDMGLIGGILFPPYFRVPFYLLPTTFFLSSPTVWLRAISRYSITISSGPNFAYSLCARCIRPNRIPNLNLSSWRLAHNGAEPIDVKTIESFSQKFSPYGFSESAMYPVYGMAEATLAIAFPKPGQDIRVDLVSRKAIVEESKAIPASPEEQNAISYVSTGTCIPGHVLTIREPFGERILQEREVGEICFSGPSVTPGYYKQIEHGSEQISELRTGDLGYLSNGELFVVDRLKDVIQVAGANYYPFDIERQVQQIPGIRLGRIAAFDIPAKGTGTNSLVIIAEGKRAIQATAILDAVAAVKSRVYNSHGIIPYDIMLTEPKSIPLTSSGKIRRRKCRELYLEGKLIPLAQISA